MKEMRYRFHEVYHIVDSEIVKAMIGKHNYGFNTFVANRIGEIQDGTNPSEWVWTAGKNNIADWITRGRSPEEITTGTIWQDGPTFLQKPVEEWPILKDIEYVDELPETKKMVMKADVKEYETLLSRIDIERFSNIKRLINVTARVQRLYRKYRKGGEKPSFQLPTDYISPQDVKDAENSWIIEAQRGMEEDMKKGRYQKLRPQVKDGVIVVGGRCSRWNEATWNNEEFIILPFKHRLSLLIARRQHYDIGHRGVSATVSMIRSRFWIIKVNKLVNKIVSKCIGCKKRRLLLHSQIMSELPIESPPRHSSSLGLITSVHF